MKCVSTGTYSMVASDDASPSSVESLGRALAGLSACAAMTLVFLAMLALAIGAGAPSAFAQQGGFNPQLQSQTSGSGTLELPTQRPQTGTGGALTIPPVAPQPGTGSALNLPSMTPQTGPELELPSLALRKQPGYEQVTVTVTNPQHGYVTDLQKGDFRLYVDGRQVPIQFFRHDLNTPVSVGILVDTSGSMQPKIPQARIAITEFLNDLNARDDVFLFAFSARPFLLQNFTTNHALVASRLMLLHAYGQTALYDAILDGLLMVEHGRYDKKVLLVVTDGMDNSSSSTLAQVIGQARRMGVLIYSIGIGDPNASSMPGIAFGPFAFGGSDDRVDAATLRILSTETGAKTFIIREIGDGELMREDMANISAELRDQYTLGFVTPDAASGGYRSIRVETPTHPELTARVRKGVTVGGAPAYAGAP
jgi:Ca-activated chloride channel family protein